MKAIKSVLCRTSMVLLVLTSLIPNASATDCSLDCPKQCTPCTTLRWGKRVCLPFPRPSCMRECSHDKKTVCAQVHSAS